jgi:hypothetical protein
MKKFILLLLAFFPTLSFAAAFNPDVACLPLDSVSNMLTNIGAITSAKDFQSSKIVYKSKTRESGKVDDKIKILSQGYAFEMRYKGTRGDVLLIASGECGYSSNNQNVAPGLNYLLMLEPTEYMIEFNSEFEPPTVDNKRAKIWREFKLKEYQSDLSKPY